MEFSEIFLKGSFIVVPKVFEDSRGSFFESFHKEVFEKKTGLKVNFVQDNQSVSQRGVLRGLHMQQGEYAQAKLVRVVKGKVLDVVVDVRKESPTFGEHFSLELSAENKKQLYTPRGFLHGFVTLEDDTIFSYKCDNYYKEDKEFGVLFNDKDLNIDWKLTESEIILSKKDRQLKTFKEYLLTSNFLI